MRLRVQRVCVCVCRSTNSQWRWSSARAIVQAVVAGARLLPRPRLQAPVVAAGAFACCYRRRMNVGYNPPVGLL